MRLFVKILVISLFGFEGWIWVLISSVPDLCILFTLITIVDSTVVVNSSPGLQFIVSMRYFSFVLCDACLMSMSVQILFSSIKGS